METEKKKAVHKSFYETYDCIIEEIYDPDRIPAVQFAIYSKSEKKVKYLPEIEFDDFILKPVTALVDKEVVLLPSEAVEYDSEKKLIEKIITFIHKYVDIDQFHEKLTAHYILMTWLFDNLSSVPYLRALGDYGTGKTRFIKVIGMLSYKPMFLAGATSDAYIFRVIELFSGTIVLNELERLNTDMRSQIVVILNNGYEKGLPVGRVEGERKKEPLTYNVFCPKVFSTREKFKDQALESRIININMKSTTRKDIPTFLSDDFENDAKELRKQLLMYRFHHFDNYKWQEDESKRKEELLSNIEPRLKQTLLPLLYVIHSKSLEKEFINFAKEFQKQIIDTRGEDMIGLVFQKLYEIYQVNESKIAVKEITEKVNAQIESERTRLTSHTIGKIIRENLGFKTHKSTGGLFYVEVNKTQLDYLIKRYPVENPLNPPNPLFKSDSKEELVDSVDFHEEIKIKEKELREKLENTRKNDPKYLDIYKKWFSIREAGAKQGLWPSVVSSNE